MNPSRERCIEIALELTRVMTNFYEEALAWPNPGGLNESTMAYFVFDGAIALAGALSQVPPHPQSAECLALIGKAMCVLKELANAAAGASDGQGEMARRAITILKALRKAGGWDVGSGEKGEVVTLQDMLNQNRRQQQQQSQPFQSQQTAGLTNVLANQAHGITDFSELSPAFGTQHGANYPSPNLNGAQDSSYIPFLNSAFSAASNATVYAQSSAPNGSSALSLPMIPSFANTDAAFAGLSSRPLTNMASPRPSQSMVMPFDILQGVHPNLHDSPEFELDWARLAGMESWYSNGAASTDGHTL